MKEKKDSEFDKLVRIRGETLEKVRKIKGKKSMAGKIEEILQFYLNNKKI